MSKICVFLLQDRVIEFAKMNSQQLLEATEKAVNILTFLKIFSESQPSVLMSNLFVESSQLFPFEIVFSTQILSVLCHLFISCLYRVCLRNSNKIFHEAFSFVNYYFTSSFFFFLFFFFQNRRQNNTVMYLYTLLTDTKG